MTLPDPHLPLNPGHVEDPEPADDAVPPVTPPGETGDTAEDRD